MVDGNRLDYSSGSLFLGYTQPVVAVNSLGDDGKSFGFVCTLLNIVHLFLTRSSPIARQRLLRWVVEASRENW